MPGYRREWIISADPAGPYLAYPGRVSFIALTLGDPKETAIPCGPLAERFIMSDAGCKLFIIRFVDLAPYFTLPGVGE